MHWCLDIKGCMCHALMHALSLIHAVNIVWYNGYYLINVNSIKAYRYLIQI